MTAAVKKKKHLRAGAAGDAGEGVGGGRGARAQGVFCQ